MAGGYRKVASDESPEHFNKRLNIEHQQWFQRRLDRIDTYEHQSALHTDHKLMCCGKEIAVPALQIEVMGPPGSDHWGVLAKDADGSSGEESDCTPSSMGSRS